MMTKSQIDTLRGLACLLVVSYHVIGADQNMGLRISDGPIRWINDGLAYLRMPLFTFLSGLVYGLHPFTGNTRGFLVGKARRLLIPMLFVGTLFATLQVMTPGTNSSAGPWYLLHLKPVAHYWFVESLFWVFLAVWAAERLKLFANAAGYLLVLTLACTLYLTINGSSWLSLEGAIYLMPYFLVGMAYSRFSLGGIFASPWIRLGLVGLAAATIVLMGMPISNPDRRTPEMLLTGMSLCLLSLSSGIVVTRLAQIGKYSYSIYLFHVFFTAFARICLSRVGIQFLALDILLGVLLGLAGPILVDHLASRFKWPGLMLLGRSTKVPQLSRTGEKAVSAA
jgi:peptidoglycan/LPS O-acetylase OafA/YrhL